MKGLVKAFKDVGKVVKLGRAGGRAGWEEPKEGRLRKPERNADWEEPARSQSPEAWLIGNRHQEGRLIGSVVVIILVRILVVVVVVVVVVVLVIRIF